MSQQQRLSIRSLITCALSSAVFSALLSCAGTSVIEEREEAQVEAEVLPTSEKDAPAIYQQETDERPPQRADIEVAIVDPLAEVRILWEAGLIEEARERFSHPDCQMLRSSERELEWSLWRGRLYLNRWTGAELGLEGDNISALLSDGDDVWAGTWTGGISRFSEPLNRYTSFDPGLPSKAVRTLNSIRRSGRSISAARYGEVTVYDRRTARWRRVTNLPISERIQDYLILGDSVYVASLGGGMWRLSGLVWDRLPQPGLFINSFTVLEENMILVCTMDRGIYLFDTENLDWHRVPDADLKYANITSAAMMDSRIILGTYGDGAYIWDLKTDSAVPLDSDSIGSGWVMDVKYDGQYVYFATFGAGVSVWNPSTGNWDSLSISDGLPSADIASLALSDDGGLWMGTLGGGLLKAREGMFGDQTR